MNALQALNLGRKHGVSPAAMHTLLAVLSDPPMRPSRIAEITGLTSASMTGAIDRLENAGMIERVSVRGDRRSRPVTPTIRAFAIFQPAIEEDAPALATAARD